MAEGAVGEEEIVKAGLGKNVAGGDGSGGAIAGWGAELAAEFKALEETAPDRLDRGGIRFPLFVKILEEGGVARVTQAAEGGGWSGGGAVGVQAVEDREGRVGLRRRLKVAHHDEIYFPYFFP